MMCVRTEYLRRGLSVFVCGWCLASGCGKSNSLAEVQGAVSWDGKPLADGVVRFVHLDGKGATSSATVTAGAFQAKLPPGSFRVEFSSPKVTGRRKMYDTPESPVVEIVDELIPPKYNIRSELTLEVPMSEPAKEYQLVP